MYVFSLQATAEMQHELLFLAMRDILLINRCYMIYEQNITRAMLVDVSQVT